MLNKRSSGILLPIFSLPNKEGIGTFGNSAYQFIDFLTETNQSYWQILPIGYTSYGNSPYQSYSSFAINPYFIDLEQLVCKGWLDIKDIQNISWGERVDYNLLWEKKYPLLQKAFKTSKYSKFQEKEALKKYWWLDDFSSFMGLKKHFGLKSRSEWSEGQTKNTLTSDLLDKIQEEKSFHIFLQEESFEQWYSLKEYAEFKGISIIGDLPIFVAEDSADVWADPQFFQLNEQGKPLAVAGVPPDYFSETGQLWGNPLYQWDELEKTNFDWWIKRIDEARKLFDIVRIDHFRGFEAYWSVPYGESTAINGEWIKAPGQKLFRELHNKLPNINIIAEDLGIITPEVQELINENNLPGMKVMQFGFDSDDTGHRPDQVVEYSVYYTGTHDNNTTEGWAADPSYKNSIKNLQDFYGIPNINSINVAQLFVEEVWKSKAILAIAPMQDILELDESARINTPSTVSSNNWQWRITSLPLDNTKLWLARITKDNMRS